VAASDASPAAQERAVAEDDAYLNSPGPPHTKGSYLQAQFQRPRRGPKKAICAVAASILTAAYHMLRDRPFYQNLGAITSTATHCRIWPSASPPRSPSRVHLHTHPGSPPMGLCLGYPSAH